MPESRRILIVEDDQILSMQYRLMLEQSGYLPVGVVMSGEEAVACVETLRPDLILMDVLLAGKMTGFEAYREIRRRHEVPVVYLSGISDDEQLRDAQELGAYGYLLKPVNGRDLHTSIEMALYKHAIENRVRQSEKRYRILFEKMNNGFGLGEVVYDEAGQPVDFLVLAINPAFQRMIRVHSRRLVGRRLGEVAPEFDKTVLLEQLERVARSGRPAQFGFYLEHGRYLEISAFSPESGQFAVIVEDVTERRRAESSLQESENRFRRLAESVREVFWLQSGDNGRQMLYVSPAFAHVFGRPCSDLEQDNCCIFNNAHPDDAPALEQARQAMELTGQPLSEEYRILHPDGQVRWIWARSYPVLDSAGQVTGYSGVAEDITERKEAEQQISDGYKRLEQSLLRMTILRKIDTAITTYNDLPVMAAAILTCITDLEEIDGALLYIPARRSSRHPDRPTLALEPAGQSGAVLKLISGQAAAWQKETAERAFASGKAEYFNDLRLEDHPGAVNFFEQSGFQTCAIVPLLAREQVKGVLLFFREYPSAENSDWRHFLESLALQTAIGIDNVEMFENLKRSNRELARAYDETISGWAQALELRDKETRGHSERVYQLAEKLARALGIEEDALLHFRRGVLLHDIGKMGVPDKILNKPEDLSPDEWVIMRQHPTYGYEMLSHIEYLRPALDVVYYHHEKWDGSGYPSGLRGEEIPLPARIFAIIDVYDALTTRRPYRPAWPRSDALTYIRQQSGKHFDPRVAEAFLDLFS